MIISMYYTRQSPNHENIDNNTKTVQVCTIAACIMQETEQAGGDKASR